MNKDKLEVISLINPKEAINLSYYRTIEDFEIIDRIEDAYYKHTIYDRSDNIWFHKCLLDTIWNAGRIQGIREERMKKKM